MLELMGRLRLLLSKNGRQLELGQQLDFVKRRGSDFPGRGATAGCPGWREHKRTRKKNFKETSSPAPETVVTMATVSDKVLQNSPTPERNKRRLLPHTASAWETCPTQVSWQPGQQKREFCVSVLII